MSLQVHNLFKALVLVLVLAIAGCEPSKEQATQTVSFTILQLNDVYEIAPVEGGASGGLARVATLRNQLLEETPNVLTVLSGDFLSPSLVGTLRNAEGKKIAGRQMVAALNALGLDLVTFGNHEFDLAEEDLLSRIDESEFNYICANVFHVKDNDTVPFYQNGKPIPATQLITFTEGELKVNLGFTAVCLDFNKSGYVAYSNVAEAALKAQETLSGKADVLFGITHQFIREDSALVQAVPGYKAFFGGHEHTAMRHTWNSTLVTKADANAKTVWVHRCEYNPETGQTTMESSLVPINASLPEEPQVAALVNYWDSVANASISTMGYDAQVKVIDLPAGISLDGREASIRSQPTNYGVLTANALQAATGASLGVFNSGSLRLDDQLSGTITQYDILRSFPYGGPVVVTKLPGSALSQLLTVGTTQNRGEGGYLQIQNAVFKDNNWWINNAALQATQEYTVAMPEFLAKGKEANLEFLGQYNYTSPETWFGDGAVRNDIRDVLIHYMPGYSYQ